jgi:serine/threonine-protein kinase
MIDGKYAVLRELGSGSTGTVYEAENSVLGKRVAMKLWRCSLAGDAQRFERFIGGARAAASIAHLNVVEIFDHGVTQDGAPYVVMERLEGETLTELVARRGALPPALACELMVQVLAGLGAAHALGVVHGNLTPSNVIVTYPRPEEPLVKLVDFGVAGTFASTHAGQEGLDGTAMYAAPERAQGGEADARSDIYAAGVILYEMLAGEPPFDGPVSEIVQKVIAGQWRPLANVNPAVPRLLALAVSHAMASKPEDRIASAHDFARQLAPYVSQPPPHSVPSGPAEGLLHLDVGASNRQRSDSAASRPPRDFPSLQLAKVAGKPKGEPLADELLQSPIIPRAPSAPKIQLSAGEREVETWSDAPSPERKASSPPSAEAAPGNPLPLDRDPPPSLRQSLGMVPWKRAAYAAAVGIGLGLLVAWLFHLR